MHAMKTAIEKANSLTRLKALIGTRVEVEGEVFSSGEIIQPQSLKVVDVKRCRFGFRQEQFGESFSESVKLLLRWPQKEGRFSNRWTNPISLNDLPV
jgi:hypothetical protein